MLLPKGYHPVVAAPGYQLHYTWVLAGEERRYGAWADDPNHAWVRNESLSDWVNQRLKKLNGRALLSHPLNGPMTQRLNSCAGSIPYH